MTSRSEFVAAWKKLFPTINAPDLTCFQLADLENSSANLDEVRKEKRKYEAKTEELKNSLKQHEFIVEFLRDMLQRATTEGNGKCAKKTGPPTAPKSVSMRRVNPDLSLDCKVPATDEQEQSKVPAYLETDLDFAVESCELSSLGSYPGYLPSPDDDSNEKTPASVFSDQDQPVVSVPITVNTEGGVVDELDHLWTRNMKSMTPSTAKGQTHNNTSRVDNKTDRGGDVTKQVVTRNFSLDSGKPITSAKPRKDAFQSQMKVHSLDNFIPVEANSSNKCTGASSESGNFSTFKPRTVTETSSDSAAFLADKRTKPVPMKRVSTGASGFKSHFCSESVDTAVSQCSPVTDTAKSSNDSGFSEDKVPPGMCKINPGRTPLTHELARAATLPASIQGNTQSVKKRATQCPKVAKMTDYINIDNDASRPSAEQVRPQNAGPPVMTIKPKPSTSPLMKRSFSDAPSGVCGRKEVSLTGMDPMCLVTESEGTSSQKPSKDAIIYEEPIPVQQEKVEEATSSEEDEPVYQNLMLLKQQSLSQRQSSARTGMFASMEYQKKHLQKQAERLSRRFSSLDANLSRSLGKDKLHNIGEDDVTDGQTGATGRASDADGGDTVVWRKRPSMILATADDNTSEDDLDVMVPTCAETEKIQMRKYVVTSIAESERMYLTILDTLMQYMQTFKNIQNTPQSLITSEDISVIFYKIPELHLIHFNFIKKLESKLEHWTGEEQIAEPFKVLALDECPLATEYLKNYQKAVSTIHKCTSESSQFAELTQNIHCKGSKEMSTLEELLHKPVVRFQRNTLVLHDLIKFTPTCHPDYDTLQKTKKIAQNFLENFESPMDKSNAENQRYLSKQGLVVEKVGSGNQRKLRQIFLFNDLFVCAKQKLSRQKITYEVKWAILLSRLEIIDDRLIAQEEMHLRESTKQETEKLQKKVSDLQNELKHELRKAKQAQDDQRNWSFRGHKSNLEKIKKKLYEQESQLMLAAPHLILKLKDRRTERIYSLLLASDYERTSWKETIFGLQSKNIVLKSISLMDVASLVNSLKLPKLTSSGSVDLSDFYLEDEALFGSLDVTVHKVYGLRSPADVYCCMEVDAFGHFCMKAKTNIVCGSTEPVWNENFDIELDGAQQLRVLVYRAGEEAGTLIGKCALELSKAWLRGDFTEETISLGDSMTLVLTLKYRSREQTIKRTPSAAQGGLFGVKISTITKREGTKIPIIVSACVKEVEERGMEDVGIYRISGVSAEIQKLKRRFEKCKNAAMAATLVRDIDINVVTDVLKLFFRELPESLFTDKLYYRFQEGMMLSDPEAKEKFMMTTFKSLPEPNYSTAVFMLDHLVRVSQHQATNKMSIHNLCTVFGPTLLRPAYRESEPLSVEQLFTAGAQDAMMQTGILYFYLSNWHNRDQSNQNTSEQ